MLQKLDRELIQMHLSAMAFCHRFHSNPFYPSVLAIGEVIEEQTFAILKLK